MRLDDRYVILVLFSSLFQYLKQFSTKGVATGVDIAAAPGRKNPRGGKIGGKWIL
jgi:hypothetical protein